MLDSMSGKQSGESVKRSCYSGYFVYYMIENLYSQERSCVFLPKKTRTSSLEVQVSVMYIKNNNKKQKQKSAGGEDNCYLRKLK